MSNPINNDPDSIKMRRNKSSLIIIGTGVAAFGIWTIVKSLMELLFGSLAKQLSDMLIGYPYAMKIFVYIFTIVIIVGEVLIRLHIASKVFRYARKKTTKQKYLFPAFLITCLSIYSIIYSALKITSGAGFSIEEYVSFFVELTSFFILIELFIVSINDRILESRLRKKAVEDAD